MEEGQVLHSSPYVAQIEKFADSLKQLSHTFLKLEEKEKNIQQRRNRGNVRKSERKGLQKL